MGAGLTPSPRAKQRCQKRVLHRNSESQHLKTELQKPPDLGIAECSVAGRALMKPIALVVVTSTAKGC